MSLIALALIFIGAACMAVSYEIDRLDRRLSDLVKRIETREKESR